MYSQICRMENHKHLHNQWHHQVQYVHILLPLNSGCYYIYIDRYKSLRHNASQKNHHPNLITTHAIWLLYHYTNRYLIQLTYQSSTRVYSIIVKQTTYQFIPLWKHLRTTRQSVTSPVTIIHIPQYSPVFLLKCMKSPNNHCMTIDSIKDVIQKTVSFTNLRFFLLTIIH